MRLARPERMWFINAGLVLASQAVFGMLPPKKANPAAAEPQPQPQPAEPELPVGLGEEDETTEYEHLAKLFRLHDGGWVEQGKGQLRLNRDNASGERRLLMHTGLRVVLDTPLFEGQLVQVMGAGILITAVEVVKGVQSTANFMLKVDKEELQSLAGSIAAGNSPPARAASAAPAQAQAQAQAQAPVDELAPTLEVAAKKVEAAEPEWQPTPALAAQFDETVR